MYAYQTRNTTHGQAEHRSFQQRFLWMAEDTSAAHPKVRSHAARQGCRRQRWDDFKIRQSPGGKQKPSCPNTSKIAESLSETQNLLHETVAIELSANQFSSPDGRSRSALFSDDESCCIELSASASSAQANSEFFAAASFSEHEQSSTAASWQHDMKDAMQDDESFYAILALASDFKCTIHQHSSPTVLQNGLQQKIFSLANLQQCLRKNPTDFSTLQAIMDLGGAAFYEGDVETTVLHHEAAKRIVDANGGLSKVATNLRDLIGVADSATSWLILKRPIFPIEDWDPGTWCKQSLSQFYFLAIKRQGQPTGNGLVWDFNNQIPNKFLAGMLAELNQLVLIRNLTISVDNRQHRNVIYRWLHVRRSAIKTYLLHHYLDVTEATGKITMEGTLEAAICIAAWYCHGFIIYQSLHVLIHFSPQILYHELEILLAQAEVTSSMTDLRLLLWLCFVGAAVEELFEPFISGKKMKRFTVQFIAIVKRLELASFYDVREVLESFLFDSVLDEFLVALLAKSDLNMARMEPGRCETV